MTGAYSGEFIRDASAHIFALLELRDYTNAEKMLRYLLGRYIELNFTKRAAHVIYADTTPTVEDDQPDGNYYLVCAYARYLNAANDMNMKQNFYTLVKGFTNYYLNENYYSSELKLIFNPQYEHSRKNHFIPIYDLLTNTFAAAALRPMVSIAKRN